MLKHKIMGAFLLIATAFSTNANIINLNKDTYFELDFTIESTNGVFDQDVNRLDFLIDYASNPWSDGSFTEEFTFFDNGVVVARNSFYPGISNINNNPLGFDFTNIRNGSFIGTFRIRAWFENDLSKNVELVDWLGWSLDVCGNNGCRYADNSWVKFGDTRVVNTTKVPEPATLAVMLVGIIGLLRMKRSN